MENIELFARRIGIEKSIVRQALTHYSFFEDKDENKANSRLVFAGMFVFKGLVAEILTQYFAGTGTQLQQILGNLFRNENLQRMFDQWKLLNWTRASEKFDIRAHKHIFVYAIFGCMTNAKKEVQQRFIFRHILNEENQHLFNHVRRNKDIEYQAKELAKNNFGEKIKTEMSIDENKLHKATVKFNDQIIISEATSKSYRYARKKALKIALKTLSDINFEKFTIETDYLLRLQKRIEEEKQKKGEITKQKIEDKEQRRLKKIEEFKRIKKARDQVRKKAQAEAKKRKEERAKRATEIMAKQQQPLSTKKRRHLEDKRK